MTVDFVKAFPPAGTTPMETPADAVAFVNKPSTVEDRRSWLDWLKRQPKPEPQPSPFALTPAFHPASIEGFGRFAREFLREPPPLESLPVTIDISILSKSVLKQLCAELTRRQPAQAELLRRHLDERERRHQTIGTF
jgi:hypothetical protein